MLKNLDRMDEGALATINSWVLKVQDDGANQAMVREAYGKLGGWGWMDRVLCVGVMGWVGNWVVGGWWV